MEALYRIKQIEQELVQLSEGQREEAYEIAKHRLAGPPVEEREYPPLQMPEEEPAEYPNWMLQIVVGLCIVVLLAAFVPSAYRMYMAGHNVFCSAFAGFIDEDITDTVVPKPEEWLCVSVGITTVLMAEIGQTVALLAIAVLGTTASSSEAIIKATRVSNRIFWGVVGMTTVIAYIGNLHVARPWVHAGPFFGIDVFAWILDLFPPTLVIGIMYAMKELMLYFIRRRFQYLIQVDKAKEERKAIIDEDRLERKAILDEPEEHPGWLRVYSLALKEAIIEANGKAEGERRNSTSFITRQSILRSMSPAEWKHLIKLQMVASDFTVDPAQVTAIERLQVKLEEQAREADPDFAPTALQEKEVVDAVIKLEGPVHQTSDGKWEYFSERYNRTVGGFASEREAAKALKSFEYHKGRREAEKK